MTTSSEATTNEAAARVQRIAGPIASPGNCGLCGKDKHPDGFADPRLDFEWYGTLYFCADCIGDFARVFGYIPPHQALALAKRVRELEESLSLQTDALLNLESAVEHLTNYRMLRNTITDANSDDSVPSESGESAESATPTISGTVTELYSATIDDEPVVSEPVAEQGPDDVPGVTSDESDDTIPIIGL